MDEEQKNQDTNILEEAEKCKKQADEYLNNWKQERADFINYRKDEAKRMAEFVKFSNEGLILEIIEIIDDLEIAAKHQAEKDGLSAILNKFWDLLKKYGVEKIKVADQTFNPVYHESVESESGGDKIKEIRAGYILGGKVIRPARIKVVK